MGSFTFTFEVADAARTRFVPVEALVDTGATFSRIPGSVLRDLGHQPVGREGFKVGDGRVVDYDIAEVPIRIGDKIWTNQCMWDDSEGQPLLGAITLESFLLAVDPVEQRLVPVEGLLMMAKHGKKYMAAAEKIDREKLYEPAEAVKVLKDAAFAGFDETVELHIRTGLDTRHADQQLRGTIVLPNGLGKSQRVLVFAEGEGARLAEGAGADAVGGDALIKEVEGGKLDFDIALATKEMMGKVGRLGRVLGPRGLMPNPRTNTVVDAEDLPKAIREAKQGRVEFRTDRTNLVHVPLGKVSFDEQALLENLGALVDAVMREKPAGAKGTYIKSLTLTSTMAPGIPLDVPATTGVAAAKAAAA